MSTHGTAIKANKYLPHDRDITATRIIEEANRAGIRVSDAFALLEKESGFRNIFGHDSGGMFPGKRVTLARFEALIHHVVEGGTSNGVGVTQLTSLGYLRALEATGKPHSPVMQARIGFRALAELQKRLGRQGGFAAYNGSGQTAEAYGRDAIAVSEKWHNRLK